MTKTCLLSLCRSHSRHRKSKHCFTRSGKSNSSATTGISSMLLQVWTKISFVHFFHLVNLFWIRKRSTTGTGRNSHHWSPPEAQQIWQIVLWLQVGVCRHHDTWVTLTRVNFPRCFFFVKFLLEIFRRFARVHLSPMVVPSRTIAQKASNICFAFRPWDGF